MRDPAVLVGTETCDDAAVYRLADGTLLVQTVDFFAPIVNDPFVYGQIAAANAISDVYAMGGRPLSGLNLLSFPPADVSPELIAEILRGGAEKAGQAGMTIVGGHTLQDHQIKYGLAVTGVVTPAELVTNRGARQGDVLVLTKPLGTGILATAIKADALPDELLGPLYETMTRLNRWACEAMTAVGVHAATDVTGFGLMGHACQMAQASGVTFRIEAGQVPILPGAQDLVAQGMLTGAGAANRAYLVDQARIGPGVDADLQDVLFDPQTNGGLLLAVPPENTPRLLDRLHEAGDTAACRIGQVLARQAEAVLVEP